MFTAALFTVAKTWKQPKCPPVDDQMKKMWNVYAMEYQSAMRKDEVLSFSIAWRDLTAVMLSEISQIEKDQNHMTALIHGI